jgi:hypothetical protein
MFLQNKHFISWCPASGMKLVAIGHPTWESRKTEGWINNSPPPLTPDLDQKRILHLYLLTPNTLLFPICLHSAYMWNFASGILWFMNEILKCTIRFNIGNL